MPTPLSSPPLRSVRSSPSSRTRIPETYTSTPPLPGWDSPVTKQRSKSRSNQRDCASPRQRPTISTAIDPRLPPPIPRQSPLSPAMSSFDSLPPPSPRRMSRSSSSSSSASASTSSSSPRVTTPPMRNRTRSGSKLLPALPLSINTDMTPTKRSKSKRGTIDWNTGLGGDDVQIIVSRDVRSPDFSAPPTPNLDLYPVAPVAKSTPGNTPPRPVRRSPVPRNRDSTVPPSPRSEQPVEPRRSPYRSSFKQDLLPPQPTYARTISPSGDSISTISDDATTPRASQSTDRPEASSLPSTRLLTRMNEHTSEPDQVSVPLTRKRDSAQRRLSALRGLVDNLDFNQHWSLSERPEDVEEEDTSKGVFWAYSEPIDKRPSASSATSLDFTIEAADQPTPLLSDISPERPRVRRMRSATLSQAREFQSTFQGLPSTPEPARSLQRSDSVFSGYSVKDDVNTTPARQTSTSRKPSSTPPRRPKQFRSSSDLMSRTPDPPRTSSLQRREVFDVASSGFSKSLEPSSPISHSTPTSTWRASLSSEHVYQALLNQPGGAAEVKRQEVLWELCETEQTFVKSMRTVLRLFAIPLKTPQGQWIQGIPERITELLDLLECVSHAHGIVATVQRDMRRRNEVLDVKSFIKAFREWVPRLEVHEWYLLRFEAVVQMVEDNVRDPDSVFGEFVRMQMKDEVLGSMSLGSMLLKPVQRLTKYPLFLRRLLDVTPHPHPSHPDILALLSTTETIILNLQATKAREEDFEQLQSLESRLHGLPEGFKLAIRGRKLVGQGSVIRVIPGTQSKELSPISTTSSSSFSPRNRANSLHSSRGSISSTISSGYSSPWDYYSTLPTPSTCRSSQFSVSSSSASSYGPPSRSSSILQSSPQRPSVSRTPSTASSVTDSRPPTPSSLRGMRRKEDVLTMLIFNDLVIVAVDTSERTGLFSGKRKADKGLKVLCELEGGVGKVVEVKDWSGWQGFVNLFTVTTFPISQHAAGAITTAYTLPIMSPPKSSSSTTKGHTLNCSFVSNTQQFLSVLSQTTALCEIGEAGGRGEESDEEREVLRGLD